MWKKFGIKNFALELLFPRFCLGCQKEESYLCEDCLSTIEISEHQYCLCEKPQRIWQGGKCQRCVSRKLNGLYFAAPYQNSLVQNLIQKFKYKPFIKELSKPLVSLIINHFQLLDNPPAFSEFLLISVPLEKRKLKQRGFNQAEELAKELSKSLKIPLLNDVLLKIKETFPQVELSGKDYNPPTASSHPSPRSGRAPREENVKGAFSCQNKDKIQGKKILLIDDVYTTGSTMEECAKVLKEFGAKEVWGVAVARG